MFSYNLDGLGTRIKMARTKQKLTQMELFPDIKGGPAYISKWESGTVIPTLPLLLRLCGVLNVSLNELLDVQDNTVIELKKGNVEFEFLQMFRVLPQESKDFLMSMAKRESRHYLETQTTFE